MKPVSVPTCSSPARIMFPPTHRSTMAETYMESWKTGVFTTAPAKVRVAVRASSPLTSPKRSATCPSRT